MSKITCITTIKEQCPDALQVQIKVNVLSENGQLWIQPEGYGGKDSVDGAGWPIGIEIWKGKLRFVIYDEIFKEAPQILDLNRAQEESRYCKAAEYLADTGRKIFTEPLISGFWNAACISASILSNKKGDRAAYEYLRNFSDKYLQDLPPDEERLWQQVLAKAVTLFKISEPYDVVKKDSIDSSFTPADNADSQELSKTDTEKYSEVKPVKCNWCGKVIETEPIKWKGLPFCSEACLDACRAVQ